MSKPVSIDEDTFDKTVLKSTKPVLVDFWATWCRPCAMVAPILDELGEKYGDKISFVKVDVEGNPKIASRYGVTSIPTLLVFKKGAPVSHVVGFRPKEELKRMLDATLE